MPPTPELSQSRGAQLARRTLNQQTADGRPRVRFARLKPGSSTRREQAKRSLSQPQPASSSSLCHTGSPSSSESESLRSSPPASSDSSAETVDETSASSNRSSSPPQVQPQPTPKTPEKSSSPGGTAKSKQQSASCAKKSPQKQVASQGLGKLHEDLSHAELYARAKQRRLALGEIVGAVNEENRVDFIVKWKGLRELERVPLKHMRVLFPQQVVDFMYQRVKWTNKKRLVAVDEPASNSTMSASGCA